MNDNLVLSAPEAAVDLHRQKHIVGLAHKRAVDKNVGCRVDALQAQNALRLVGFKGGIIPHMAVFQGFRRKRVSRKIKIRQSLFAHEIEFKISGNRRRNCLVAERGQCGNGFRIFVFALFVRTKT